MTSDQYQGASRGECGILLWVAAYQFIKHFRAKKQAMEMTEYGKHGKP